MKTDDIRSRFLAFFEERGHTVVPSGSLVPAQDPTLLFTNAGMVQFKRVFLGQEDLGFARAATSQKCVRAGGKHNDLEEVGRTTRHHTFFEMLGNFSFGDYFKKEAIRYAWELMTEVYGLDPERFYATVHDTDDDAAELWGREVGLPPERVYRLGDEDNFWQMADTGPCGPCSELHYDLRDPRTPLAGVDEFVELNESGRIIELWNLVFMQFDRDAEGTLHPLPAPCVDTGAGLERIASVLQGADSNYHTDLFAPLLERVADLVGRPYDRTGEQGVSYRVLADHARAVAFLLCDGVFPSNEGRGYVLRRILRRAVRHAWLLGRREPTLAPLTGRVTDLMKDAYPDLAQKHKDIERITRAEEERFLETVEGGLKRLDELKEEKVISGEDAFKLYDTYGFPLDLTQVVTAERGQTVDVEGFERALGQQRRRSRAAAKFGEGPAVVESRAGEWVAVKRPPKGGQRWVGYETTHAETDVLAFRQSGDVLELVLEENPFYAESGGQVSDTGVVKGDGWEVTVEDVAKVDGRSAVLAHFGEPFEPTPVEARVNESRRRNVERNHTGTHLVHAALRKILGTHVRQMGSLVAPDRLRFDFAHHGPVDRDTLARIEEDVNEQIWRNLPVQTREMKYKEAIAQGAMAFFQEKYGDVVRVVDVPGVSLELCGGTHAGTTGQIGLFRFTHQTGAAAGVRRIEAITGPAAYERVRELERRLDDAAGLLKTQPEHLVKKIESLLERQKQLERGGVGGTAVREERVTLSGDVTLVLGTTDVEDKKQLATLIDAYRQDRQGTVAVIFSGTGVHVGLSEDLVSRGFNAGAIASTLSGGRGGGRPHFASGGIAPDAVASTRARAPDLLKKYFLA